MRLKQLHLQNFKGFRDFTLTADGQNVRIFGTNGSGKTTVLDAITWLLYDRSSNENNSFSPKAFDDSGNYRHNEENTVTGVFVLDGGGEVTLEKTMKEVWQNKRGSRISEFTGNKTDYSIDGVPVPKKQYDDYLAGIFDVKYSRILTQPLHFANVMNWKDRRAILIDMCGDVSDDEIIANTADLNGLNEYISKPGDSGERYTVDEYKKIAEQKMKKINQQLDLIPARIDEATRAMPDVGGIGEEQCQKSIDSLQSEILQLNDNLIIAKSTDKAQSIRRQVAELQTVIAEEKAAYDREYIEKTTEICKKITDLTNKKIVFSGDVLMLKSRKEKAERELSAMSDERARLTSLYYTEEKKQFNPDDEICKYCGQALPPESVEKNREKFNENRSNELIRLRSEIESKCSKAMISGKGQQIAVFANQIAEAENQFLQFENQIKALEAEKPAKLPFEQSENYAEYMRKINELQAVLRSDESGNAKQIQDIELKIGLKKNEIALLQQNLNKIEAAKVQSERIAELEQQEKQLNTEYEFIQRGLFLCEEFIKAKVSLLTDRINSRFKTVKFKLFKTQVNGGIEECCDVMIPCGNALVEFAPANNAAKVNAGLEIIDALAEHFNQHLPVVFDNAESVVKMIEFNQQCISTFVSENDDKLRFEVG